MSFVEQARKLALALPGAAEQDHHGRPSFRVDGRIFATLWDAEHMNVMVDQPGIRSYVERDPRVYAEVWWGRRLAAVRVTLALVGEHELGELLSAAWERKGGSSPGG